MKMTAEKEGGTLTISLEGRIDALSCPEFDRRAGELVVQGASRFIIDLSGLEYISSAGLRSLLQLSKKVEPDGGEIVLCGPGGVVKEVLDVSGFGRVFAVYANLEEARKALP